MKRDRAVRSRFLYHMAEPGSIGGFPLTPFVPMDWALRTGQRALEIPHVGGRFRPWLPDPF